MLSVSRPPWGTTSLHWTLSLGYRPVSVQQRCCSGWLIQTHFFGIGYRKIWNTKTHGFWLIYFEIDVVRKFFFDVSERNAGQYSQACSKSVSKGPLMFHDFPCSLSSAGWSSWVNIPIIRAFLTARLGLRLNADQANKYWYNHHTQYAVNACTSATDCSATVAPNMCGVGVTGSPRVDQMGKSIPLCHVTIQCSNVWMWTSSIPKMQGSITIFPVTMQFWGVVWACHIRHLCKVWDSSNFSNNTGCWSSAFFRRMH